MLAGAAVAQSSTNHRVGGSFHVEVSLGKTLISLQMVIPAH